MGWLSLLGEVIQGVANNIADTEELFMDLDNYDLCEKISLVKENNYTMIGAGINVLEKRATSMSRKELYRLFNEFAGYGNNVAASVLYKEMQNRGMIDDD